MNDLKKTLILSFVAILSFGFIGCSQDAEEPHVHTFATEWTNNETYHWHGTTCGHDEKRDLDEHNASEELGKDATGHWNVCDVCNGAFELTYHTWNHEDFQYDAASGKEIKTCTVCGFIADKNHAHIEDSGTVTKKVTLDTDGVRIYKCTVCGNERMEPITKPKLYESPVDAETGLAATKSSRYIYFGVFPKTVLPVNSTVTVDETISVKMKANTYYRGSDGEYYAKVMENALGTDKQYKYSDGTQAKRSDAESYRYFKVEPIKWKVITDCYTGKCLLFAEDILTSMQYCSHSAHQSNMGFRNGDEIDQCLLNNYKYSEIRAYLNGLDFYYLQDFSTVKKSDYVNNGFLQTAFTDIAQSLIVTTTVDNSGESTTDVAGTYPKADGSYCDPDYNIYERDYTCLDTTDKIFLLSIKEISSYGFMSDVKKTDEGRIRLATDYAMANHLSYWHDSSMNYTGSYWLRSPQYDYYQGATFIKAGGLIYHANVNGSGVGVVPALCLDLQ